MELHRAGCLHLQNPLQQPANLYLIKPCSYTKYMTDTITTEYKKTSIDTMKKINTEAATIARKYELDDRIEAMAMKPAYLTLKDHKEDFPARLKFRLINPCKNNIGNVTAGLEFTHVHCRGSARH